MRWLTEDAILVCDHGGKIAIVPTQTLVRIAGRRVLVAPDPEGRSIAACPNVNPVIGLRPCVTTLKVKSGYSGFIRIAGRAVSLDSVSGLTDGSPPGTVRYTVVAPGQALVGAGG